jgi:hypothetical protein
MPNAPAPGHNICALQQDHRADAVIAALAARQHGVVSRIQLLAAGLSRRQIQWRLQTGRLHAVFAGVYSVGHPILSQEGIWMAAVLAGGEAARLSFWSAAALARLRTGGGPTSHVTCPRSRRSTERIAFHEAKLPADEVTELRGIPATTPSRTILDLATVAPSPSLTRMTAAIGPRPKTEASLAELLDRYPRKPGALKLRAVIASPIPMTRSDLEAAYLERFEKAGIPPSRVNAVIEGHEVDFVWDEHGVAAELDTYATHGSRQAFKADRARDRKLAAKWIIVRLTDEDPTTGSPTSAVCSPRAPGGLKV